MTCISTVDLRVIITCKAAGPGTMGIDPAVRLKSETGTVLSLVY
jgi:hypothetical protein